MKAIINNQEFNSIIYSDTPCSTNKGAYQLGNRLVCYGCWINYWSTGKC